MIQFKWQDSRIDITCQNMSCNNKLNWKNNFWIWSWNGETFCSNKCRKGRIDQWKLRYMYFSSTGFLKKDWGCIYRTVKYRINKWINPLEWLKKW